MVEISCHASAFIVAGINNGRKYDGTANQEPNGAKCVERLAGLNTLRWQGTRGHGEWKARKPSIKQA
jgi:hypothetical protein